MYTCHSIFAQINSVILLIDSKGGEGERERGSFAIYYSIIPMKYVITYSSIVFSYYHIKTTGIHYVYNCCYTLVIIIN